ncbi:hypothetical protein D3C74_236860 [compost metagenome]
MKRSGTITRPFFITEEVDSLTFLPPTNVSFFPATSVDIVPLLSTVTVLETLFQLIVTPGIDFIIFNSTNVEPFSIYGSASPETGSLFTCTIMDLVAAAETPETPLASILKDIADARAALEKVFIILVSLIVLCT